MANYENRELFCTFGEDRMTICSAVVPWEASKVAGPSWGRHFFSCWNINKNTLRRLHLDLIFAYKLLYGLVNIRKDSYFSFSNTRTRGHSMKLSSTRLKNDVRKRFFSTRIINVWNSLPHNVVEARSVSNFKRLLNTKQVNEILWQYLKGGGLA